MPARYNRAFGRDLFKAIASALRPGGRLSYLIHDLPTLNGDPCALDVQMREHSQLMYYHGTTRLLVVTLLADDKSVGFQVSAHKTYSGHANCMGPFRRLKECGTHAPRDGRDAFCDYLAAALEVADDRFYKNGHEGFWQNQLCVRFGCKGRPDDEWIVIDRECVIGFGGEKEKVAFYGPILSRHRAACEQLRRAAAGERWRATNLKKGYGDELDMLAVDGAGNLLAIELKWGSNTSGIYWGPVQVGVYRDALQSQLKTLGPCIVDLVEQKVTLGMLPPWARNRLPASGFEKVIPVLAVARPNPKSDCWLRLAQVMQCVGSVQIVTIGSPNSSPISLSDVVTKHIVVDRDQSPPGE